MFRVEKGISINSQDGRSCLLALENTAEFSCRYKRRLYLNPRPRRHRDCCRSSLHMAPSGVLLAIPVETAVNQHPGGFEPPHVDVHEKHGGVFDRIGAEPGSDARVFNIGFDNHLRLK